MLGRQESFCEWKQGHRHRPPVFPGLRSLGRAPAEGEREGGRRGPGFAPCRPRAPQGPPQGGREGRQRGRGSRRRRELVPGGVGPVCEGPRPRPVPFSLPSGAWGGRRRRLLRITGHIIAGAARPPSLFRACSVAAALT